MTIKNKRILLTGGAGFIGSTIAGRLAKDNKILIYDNFVRDSLKYKSYPAGCPGSPDAAPETHNRDIHE